MTYREMVLRNCPNLNDKEKLTLGAMGLSGEAGETSEVIKKHLFQGTTLDRDKVIKELGDVRWYLELLCHCLDTTLQEVEEKNIEKLKLRFPNGFTAKDSEARVDMKEETK